MIPIESQPILTAAQMRAAEDRAIAAGSSVKKLMERAGAGVAEAVRRLAGGAPVTIMCGQGNNGGDGYVAARILRANGIDVRVAASGDPKTDAAAGARAGYDCPVTSLTAARSTPVMVDALFGTGLSRWIDNAINDQRDRLQRHAALSIAVDLPSGLDCDTGEMLCASLRHYDLTLALGAVKPVHVAGHSASTCGTVRIVDLGIEIPVDGDQWVIGSPRPFDPDCNSTKYNRGMVAIVGGLMPGAAALAAEAAMRAGAGYVLLLADQMPQGAPHALVRRDWSPRGLGDERIGSVLIGPGLGRDDDARAKLDAVLAVPRTLVIDGDALHLIGDRTFHDRAWPVVLTPHAGEFKAMFGDWTGSKIDATRAAAKRSGAVVVFKGPDTVISDRSGKVIVSPNGSSWLSSAGTGDVLAGVVAAQATHFKDQWYAFPVPVTQDIEKVNVETAVWIHGEAARRLGGAFIADDLMREVSTVRAAL